MSNVLTFKSANHDLFHAEATPRGVNIMTRNDAGMNEHVCLVTYSDAVTHLDSGRYDEIPDEGFTLHFAVADGGARGWFDFTAQHNVTMWRWLIAATFISEMKRENGTTTVTEPDGTSSQVAIYSNGKVSIPVYPFSERLAMANNIEGALIERYGPEQGAEKAIVFYQSMLDVDVGELTSTGREILAGLHDCFIDDIEQSGLPEAPVAH
ncbi:hypothetical protein [Klebsiella oxytoca]|uniref:hypothetical protein n=1 Tax=Klebsiella oxytoca TaxID=571 RepID=UPI0038796BCF